MRFSTWQRSAQYIPAGEDGSISETDAMTYGYVTKESLAAGSIDRAHAKCGNWCLTIGNDSECGDDLLFFEAKLYLWLLNEGYFADEIVTDDDIFEWCSLVNLWFGGADGSDVVFYDDCTGNRNMQQGCDKKTAAWLAYHIDSLRQYLWQNDITHIVINPQRMTVQHKKPGAAIPVLLNEVPENVDAT